MPNITLSVDEHVVKKVRKVAVDRDTTLTAMVREFLHSVADSDRASRQTAADALDRTFGRLSRDRGGRNWTREELYDR